MVAFTLNGQKRELALDGETPLLWALREHLQLTAPSSAAASQVVAPAPSTSTARRCAPALPHCR